MKTLTTILAATIAVAVILSTPVYAASVTATFDYDFTNAKVCSESVLVNCIEKFEIGLLEGTTFTSKVSVPITGSPSSKVSGLTGAFTVDDKYGNQTVSAITVAKDGQGNRITSDPSASVAPVVTIRPKGPNSVTVTVTVTVTTQ